MYLKYTTPLNFKESNLTIEIGSYKSEMEKRLMNNDFKYIYDIAILLHL